MKIIGVLFGDQHGFMHKPYFWNATFLLMHRGQFHLHKETESWHKCCFGRL